MRRKRSARARPRRAGASVLVTAVALAGSMTAAGAAQRPTVIPLPDGFQPEGIVTSGADRFFVGSIPSGAVYRGDLRTGTGSIFIEAREGRSAIGLALGGGMLFVAGGATGQAYVYDARSGDEVAALQLTTDDTFVNDVVTTSEAAYLTDSVNPVLYKVPILARGEIGQPQTLPLSGDIVYTPGFNANGIDATPDGETLVIVQSNEGKLFTVDPDGGLTGSIDLGGARLVNGDGILLESSGRLWVLRNRNNLLVSVQLDPDLNSGAVIAERSHASFDVPTTLARAGNRLAIVNARFGTAGPQPAEYWVTQLER